MFASSTLQNMFKFEKMPYLKEGKSFVSEETGEIMKADTYVVEDEKHFAAMYFRIATVMDDLRKSDIMILTLVASRARYNDETIHIGRDFKEEMAEYMKCTVSAINNGISRLVRSRILVHDTSRSPRSSKYSIHPAYIFHGDRDTRMKRLKYVLELELKQKNP